MRRIGILGLCVLAALAISSVAVATASAEAPEFGRCIKKAKAEGAGYSDAGCTTAVGSGAKYEWLSGPGAKAHFTSVSRFVLTSKDKVCLKWKKLLEEGKTKEAEELLEEHHFTPKECEETLSMHGGRGEDQEPVTLETVSGSVVECEELHASGEYSGTKAISNLNTTFTGCNTFDNISCESAGASTGEIKTGTLDGSLGIIKKESVPVNNTVGIDLYAASGNIAEFECGPIIFGYEKVIVTGSVIHEVKANKMVLEENEKFLQKKGYQKPENFDGEAQDVLESSGGGAPYEQAGEGLLTELTNEEKIEVNTVL
jgi:hypothetical protein